MKCEEARRLLNSVSRENLGFYPTPFYKLENLSSKLGVNLYIKREDFSGQSLFGGNKIRKLEYLIADAKKQGCEYVFTYGATQSNHAMQTVEVCRKAGLKPILYLVAIVEPDENDMKSNLLLDKILGAEVHIVAKQPGETMADADKRMYKLGQEHAERLLAEGHKSYNVPMGGASPMGTVGFISGFVELQEQMDKMGVKADYLYHATGTGGTMAGLVAGKKLLGSDIDIVSVDVMYHAPEFAENSAQLANDALACIGAEPLVKADDFHLAPFYYQPGYEVPNEYGTNGIKTLAYEEGLLLDPVYSGKAFGGLLDNIKSGKIPQGSTVVFLHTGGATALFAEKEILGDLF